MRQNPKIMEKSDLHTGIKTTLTLQRVLDGLKNELQHETDETEATTQFKEGLSFIEKEYSGISKIVDAYEKAYENFNGTMKSVAQQQWESIVSWSDNLVSAMVTEAITTLREGEFYAGREKKLKDDLAKAEEAYYSLQDYHHYFAVKERKAIAEWKQIKTYEKRVGDYFTELKKLYDTANGFKDAGKHNSVFAVRLELDDIRKKTLPIKDGGSLADPETFKKNLTDQLRKVIAFKHERFLWHKDYLSKKDEAQKDLRAKQNAVTKTKQNYEDHFKDLRDRLIREAEDIQFLAGRTNTSKEKAKKPAETKPRRLTSFRKKNAKNGYIERLTIL